MHPSCQCPVHPIRGTVRCILWGSVRCTPWGSVRCILWGRVRCTLSDRVRCIRWSSVRCILWDRVRCILRASVRCIVSSFTKLGGPLPVGEFAGKKVWGGPLVADAFQVATRRGPAPEQGADTPLLFPLSSYETTAHVRKPMKRSFTQNGLSRNGLGSALSMAGAEQRWSACLFERSTRLESLSS